MANSVDILLVSKKHNFLKNLRFPLSIVLSVVAIFTIITISTIALCINRTRRTFVRLNLTKAEREGADLIARLDSLKTALEHAQFVFDRHVTMDNRERTYWQMAHVHPDIWSMGIGGKKAERSPLIVNRNTQRTLNEIDESLDVLKGKYFLRQSSLRDIQEQIENNLLLWSHIPAIHPLPGGRICSGFGYRTDPIDRRIRMHWGVDIGAPRGKTIIATADGVVSQAGWVSGYGWTVVVDHGYGFRTAYAHCQKLLVKNGDPVKRGQAVAEVGSTGRSISPHLHYEVRVSGMKINPYKYINNSEVIFD